MVADIKWDSYFHVTIHLWLYAMKTKRYVYHNHVTSVKIRARYYVSKDTNQMTNTSTSKILDLQQGHIHLQISTSSTFPFPLPSLLKTFKSFQKLFVFSGERNQIEESGSNKSRVILGRRDAYEKWPSRCH